MEFVSLILSRICPTFLIEPPPLLSTIDRILSSGYAAMHDTTCPNRLNDARVAASEHSPREPLLISDRQAAALLGISRAHFHRLRAAGKVGPEPIPLGRCRRWERDALVRWVSIGKCCDAETWRAMEAQRRRLRAV
jgi:predicted DNA-binding transcriptional regulator AlpA